MSTKFNFGVDWRRKDFICWDARPGDTLNLLPRPLQLDQFYRWIYDADGTGASATDVMLQSNFGKQVIRLTAPMASGQVSLLLGEEWIGGLLQFPIQASTTYTLSIWLKGNDPAGYPAYPFSVEAACYPGRITRGSTVGYLTNDWQRFDVPFTTDAADTYMYIELRMPTHPANLSYDVTGAMLVLGTQTGAYNAGNSVDLYDNLTQWTTDAEWFLGFHTPYQDDADDSILHLDLNNSDRLFSPEYASSPLAGLLTPLRPIKVRSSDGTTTRTHWSGWIESLQPSVGKFGARGAEIKAAGAMLFFEDVETRIPVQENRRTDQIIADLLNEVPIAPALAQSMLLDAVGYAELGVNTFLPDPILASNLNAGQTILAYAADNWIQALAPGETQSKSFNVYRAIKDVVAAERGRFFFDREGTATFWDRHYLLKRKYDSASDPTFDDVMQGLSYEYAGLGEFKNEVIVTCHPRSVSSSSEELLWSLDQPLTISAGESRKLTVSYKDNSENRIGGKDVHLANATFSEGSGSISVTVGGNRAVLEITNDVKATNSSFSQGKAVLATCELRGTKITDFGAMEATSRDELSVNLYGRRVMRLSLSSVDDLDNAQTIADFERGRRSHPSGKVKSMTLLSHASLGGNQHAEQVQRSIGDLVRIKETQTEHDSTYFLIGEQHHLSQPEEYFETIWYLESATDANWLVIDMSRLDEAVLAY